MLHLIAGAGIPGAVEDECLPAAVEWAQSHEVDYRVPVTPGRTAASDAARWLMESGHELGGNWIKLIRDASPLDFVAPPGVEVFRRGYNEDESFGDPFGEVLGIPDWASTFFLDLPGMEGWHCYVAVEGDYALAHAAMVIQGGVAEIALGANPGARRHAEGQMAVLRRCIDAAASAGCEAIFAETPAFDSEPLADSRESLRRAGFEQAFARRDWRPPREAVAETAGNRLWFEV